MRKSVPFDIVGDHGIAKLEKLSYFFCCDLPLFFNLLWNNTAFSKTGWYTVYVLLINK